MSFQEWRRAYARQAQADMQAREVLLREKHLPPCEQLHLLQMACEKLAKAYQCSQKTDLTTLQASHAWIERTLPIPFRPYYSRHHRATLRGQMLNERSRLFKDVRSLLREIDLLVPSVTDGGRRPDNAEYPWADDLGKLWIPAEYEFLILPHLAAAAGQQLVSFLFDAADDLAQ